MSLSLSNSLSFALIPLNQIQSSGQVDSSPEITSGKATQHKPEEWGSITVAVSTTLKTKLSKTTRPKQDKTTSTTNLNLNIPSFLQKTFSTIQTLNFELGSFAILAIFLIFGGVVTKHAFSKMFPIFFDTKHILSQHPQQVFGYFNNLFFFKIFG